MFRSQNFHENTKRFLHPRYGFPEVSLCEIDCSDIVINRRCARIVCTENGFTDTQRFAIPL